MKILHTLNSRPDYIPAPALSEDQIVFSGEYPDRSEGGRIVSRKLPNEDFDLAAMVKKLPADQRPDLVVVQVDSTRLARPRNIAGLGCRSVVFVGDTQHLRQPIKSLLEYVESERFDAVLFQYTRQHAHFFIEAGLGPACWLPGFNVEHIALPPVVRPEYPLSFVGNVGGTHFRRRAILEALRDAGLPLYAGVWSKEATRRIHAQSLVCLNCSLNGDLNLRALEILASGGCLLTDRLGPHSGLELLFQEDRDLVYYDSIPGCVEAAGRLLANPARTMSIGRAGKAAYERTIPRNRIFADFFAFVEKGEVRPDFDLGKDGRTRLPRVHDRAGLMRRVTVYELLQSAQVRVESVSVLATPNVDPYLISDGADLARVKFAVDVRGAGEKAKELSTFLARAGLARHVRLAGRPIEIKRDQRYIVLTTLADWRERRPDRLLLGTKESLVIVTDLPDDKQQEIEVLAGGLVRVESPLPVFAPLELG